MNCTNNCITNNNGESTGWAKITVDNIDSTKANKMTIYADQTFDSIDAQTSFNIVLVNDAKLLLVGDCENVLSVVSGQRIRIYLRFP